MNASTDELKLAAKDMLAAAGGVAGAARNVLKDVAAILTDTAHEAASAAKDTAQAAKAKAAERAAERRACMDVEEEDIFEDEPLVNTPAAGADEADLAAEVQDAADDTAAAPDGEAAGAAHAPEKEDKTSSPAAGVQEAKPTTVVEELD